MNYTTVPSEVYFLKMEEKPTLRENNIENTSLIEIAKPIDISWYRELYSEVGKNFNWLDRLFMDDAELYSKINSSKTHIYTLNIKQKHAGYCELVEEGDHVEILYFGLLPDFIGKGYGRYFLNKTIELAWRFSPKHIQLNTCDMDHPNAIHNYKKAGFVLYKTVTEMKKVLVGE
ncbi:GNAT family N-acetyltransferase [Saccharicrinis sp. GN24d3]|uniref:GNAT family N-acetyltransferase n=1 Tax=Saccharicrinis sp. GN24d3 TaxID=3458416 RepID=UPI004035504B